MSYSDLFLKKKQLPVPLAALIIALLLMTVFLTRMFASRPITSRASKKMLKRMEVVNVGYNQAAVFWQTDSRETGWLVYGYQPSKIENIVFDERDTQARKNSYLNHYVILRNLEPNRQYYFKVVSGSQLIENTDSRPFQFMTAASMPSSSNISPAYGKVQLANAEPLASGSVIISFKNSYPLFTLIKLSGEWLIPLNNVVDKISGKARNLAEDERGLIEIYDEVGGKSSVEIITVNLSPVPQTIIIGKDYSFLTKENVLGARSLAGGVKDVIGISYPKEKSIIPSERPLIKGTGIPGKEVVVVLKSRIDYSSRTTVDEGGVWMVVPTKDLPPETYQMTVTTRDEKNAEIKLSRSFIIAKSGEQVMGEATAEPTLAATATPLPTAAPTVASTPLPTIKQAGFDPLPLSIASGFLIIIGLGIILAF